MSDRTIYFSERGNPLIYWGPAPKDKPVLTVENYCKWYSLYAVMPDGLVLKVAFRDYADLHLQDDGGLWHDHALVPEAYERICERLGFDYHHESYEFIVGRYDRDFDTFEKLEAEVATLRGLLTEALDENQALRCAFKPATHAAEIEGLKAERDDLRRQLTEAQTTRDECHASHDLDAETIAGLVEDVERLTADNAALVETHADNAALFEALLGVRRCFEPTTARLVGLDAILAQPHPGARMLEELAALRKVADAGERACCRDADCLTAHTGDVGSCALRHALDAIRNRKEPANG